MLPLTSKRYHSHCQPWGSFPVPALLGQALPLAAVVWMSCGALLSCLPVAGGEKRREGREAEAGEKRPSLITPPQSCVGSGMDG